MRLKGTLVEWNDDRGFGFIEAEAGGQRAFCHISAFAVRVRRPMPGDRVTYETGKDERGRLRALQVKPVALERATASRTQAPKRTDSRKTSVTLPLVVALSFFGLLTAFVVAGRLPWFVPALYLVTSMVTLFAYGFDKSHAMNGRWRTPESTLHLFALVGGWPGAWIAQALFRHKHRKTEFMAMFVVCVLVNVGVLGWIVFDPQNPIGQALRAL